MMQSPTADATAVARRAPSSTKQPELVGYLSAAEVAAQLGVSVRTLATWHARRRGPPRTTFGKKILYRSAAVEDWLRKNECSFEDDAKPPGARGRSSRR